MLERWPACRISGWGSREASAAYARRCIDSSIVVVKRALQARAGALRRPQPLEIVLSAKDWSPDPKGGGSPYGKDQIGLAKKNGYRTPHRG